MPKNIEPEYEVWPVLAGEGEDSHTEHLFCYDMPCPCHEDSDRVQELGQQVQDGLASVSDADRIYRGKTV